MNGCDDTIKDLLPLVAGGHAEEADRERVAAHVADCADCAAEFDTLRALARGRPTLPPALAERIREGVHAGLSEGRARRRVPTWVLAAAAGAVLALGTPSLMQRLDDRTPVGEGVPDVVPSVWLSEDPLVAGAPVLDNLSDEALARLLEEMER